MLSSALIFTVVGTGQASYSGDGDMARRAGSISRLTSPWTGRAISIFRMHTTTVYDVLSATAGRLRRSPAPGKRGIVAMAEPRPGLSSIHPMASPLTPPIICILSIASTPVSA